MNAITDESNEIDYESSALICRIPPPMFAKLQDYAYEHIPVCEFLEYIISNDMLNAYECADDENRLILPAYTVFLYYYTDPECWGSKEAYFNWVTKS